MPPTLGVDYGSRLAKVSMMRSERRWLLSSQTQGLPAIGGLEFVPLELQPLGMLFYTAAETWFLGTLWTMLEDQILMDHTVVHV